MRRKPVSPAILVLLALIVVAASGCGGGKGRASRPNGTSAGATAPTTTTPGIGALATLANCTQLSGLEAAFVSALVAGKSSAGEEGAVLRRFAAKTPPGVRPDFDIIAAAFAKLAGALNGANGSSAGRSSPAELASLERLGSQLSDPELTKAESAIAHWAAANCHG